MRSNILADALADLAAHVGDPSRVAEDARAAGHWMRHFTRVVWALAVGAIVLLPFSTLDRAPVWLGRHGGFAIALALIAWAVRATYADRLLPPRSDARSPTAAAISAYRALGRMRDGYFWAALSPHGRRVAAHASVMSVGIELRSPADVALFTKALFRAWGGPRQLAATGATVTGTDDDVAEVALDLEKREMGLGTVAIGGALSAWCYLHYGAVAAIVAYAGTFLLWSRRRRDRFTIRKTMLRGPNGLWYLLDPNLRDDAPASRTS